MTAKRLPTGAYSPVRGRRGPAGRRCTATPPVLHTRPGVGCTLRAESHDSVGYPDVPQSSVRVPISAAGAVVEIGRQRLGDVPDKPSVPVAQFATDPGASACKTRLQAGVANWGVQR